jgi:MFS family permease
LGKVTPAQQLVLLLDASPLNGIQRWLWVLSTGGTLLDGFAIFVLGVAMPLIIDDFHIDGVIVGLIGASLVVGAVFGAGLGGLIADHLGRKKLMLADMIIICAGAAISALAKGPAMLFIGQFLVGVGIGIDFPVSSSYLSEVLPRRDRARLMVATIACQALGMLLAAAITLVLLKTVHSMRNWQLFLASEGVIAFLFCLLRLSASDSPHWLMARGRFAEAAQAFIRIMPEQRSVATYQQCWKPGPRKVDRARKNVRDFDSFLTRLPSSYGACRNPVVLDGYRHLRRGSLHSDYPGCD